MFKWSIMKTSDKSWGKKLSKEQYNILRGKGTEPAFSGKLLENKNNGVYVCSACGNELFSSKGKFDSGSGWPSFFQPVDKDHVKQIEDNTLGVRRVEIECQRCKHHEHSASHILGRHSRVHPQ